MSLYDWLLFLHVLAAFVLVSGATAFGVVVLGGGGEPVRRVLAGPATGLWNAGGIGVLVLGIWLAIERDTYEVWDAWIIAAVVLWLIASAAGGPLSRGLRDGSARLSDDRARQLLAVVAVMTVLLLLDMIFKPWAG